VDRTPWPVPRHLVNYWTLGELIRFKQRLSRPWTKSAKRYHGRRLNTFIPIMQLCTRGSNARSSRVIPKGDHGHLANCRIWIAQVFQDGWRGRRTEFRKQFGAARCEAPFGGISNTTGLVK